MAQCTQSLAFVEYLVEGVEIADIKYSRLPYLLLQTAYDSLYQCDPQVCGDSNRVLFTFVLVLNCCP